ncbi:MAG TPA: hypothetical protein DEQ28_08035 [Clostridiales bacterium]|nr:hypothetical protein [Clostridiales bacterium]
MPLDGVGLFAAGSLLLVAALGLGARLLRRDLRPAGRHLELVATLPLGQGKHLQLVRAGSGMYLIGCADKQLSLLAAIPPDQAPAVLAGDLTGDRSRGKRRSPPGASAEAAGSAALDFRRELGLMMAGRGVRQGED